MSDQDQETFDCSVCNGSGLMWKRSKRRLCSFCDGEGQLTPDETVSCAIGLADVVASLPGDRHGSQARAKEASAEQTAAAKELEGRFLTERGFKVRPGLDRHQLLPQQGGEPSKRQRELAAILEAAHFQVIG